MPSPPSSASPSDTEDDESRVHRSAAPNRLSSKMNEQLLDLMQLLTSPQEDDAPLHAIETPKPLREYTSVRDSGCTSAPAYHANQSKIPIRQCANESAATSSRMSRGRESSIETDGDGINRPSVRASSEPLPGIDAPATTSALPKPNALHMAEDSNPPIEAGDACARRSCTPERRRCIKPQPDQQQELFCRATMKLLLHQSTMAQNRLFGSNEALISAQSFAVMANQPRGRSHSIGAFDELARSLSSPLNRSGPASIHNATLIGIAPQQRPDYVNDTVKINTHAKYYDRFEYDQDGDVIMSAPIHSRRESTESRDSGFADSQQSIEFNYVDVEMSEG